MKFNVDGKQLDLPPVDEEEIYFKRFTDHTEFVVKNPETEDEMFRISGYSLQIAWNPSMLSSVEAMEGMLDGIKNLFRQIILQDMVRNKETNDH